jgi:hypothetical protein
MSWSNEHSSEAYKLKLLKEKMEGINVDVMIRFIESRGFKRVEHPNDKLAVFEGTIPGVEHEKPFCLVLPNHDKYRESFREIVSRMELFAFIDEITFEQMIEKVKQFK